MKNYRITNVMLDSEQIYRAMMAEYALIVAGKSEEEAPMQYAKCDMPGIFKVLYAEELGAVCAKIGGYIDNVEATTEGFTRIALRLPAMAPAMLDSLLRRRMEDCIVASVLLRCLLPVKSTQAEYRQLVDRSRLALRSLRHLLAPRS